MSEQNLAVSTGEKVALIIDDRDNVAVALADLQTGDLCIIRKGNSTEEVMVGENIPFGHKLALVNLNKDESVLKFGEEIGKMKEPVQRGSWIHSHNMICERAMRHGR